MEPTGKKPVKGIKIRTVNLIMILISCCLYLFLTTATIRAFRKYEALISATDNYIDCQKNAVLLTDSSDYLTEQVRLYTINAQPQYMEAYFTEVNTTRRREQALEQLKEYKVSEQTYHFLEIALEHSNELMEQEIYAMKLIATAQGENISTLPQAVQYTILSEADQALSPGEMTQKAQQIVFGADYQSAKASIQDNTDYFLTSIIDDTKQEQQTSALSLKNMMTRQQILISILFVENVFTFLMIIWLIIRPLKIYVNNIKEEKMMEITGSYEFQYLALTYNDIYEVNAANEVLLRHQAEHDPLTGIMNRGAFEQIRQILKVKSNPLALLIIDVDKFKLINDGYGHEVGDAILKKVAKLLVETFRSTDYPARIGGDEFAVIIPDMTPDMKSILSNKINFLNETLQHPKDGLPQISLSVGAAFSENGFTDDLYNKADTALYYVKEHGRCGYSIYGEQEKSAEKPNTS